MSFDTSVSLEKLQTIAQKMNERNFNAQVVKTKAEALAKLKELIPAGAEVMSGSSTTLNEIGLTEYMKSEEHDWKNLQAEVWAESDDEERNHKRRMAVTAEYFLSSMNAITEDGQMVSVDASGSRVGAMLFAAEHLVLVIGNQKVTQNLDQAMERIREYVFPLENKRAQEAYGSGSAINKWAILEGEFDPQRIQVILVDEKLGY